MSAMETQKAAEAADQKKENKNDSCEFIVVQR